MVPITSAAERESTEMISTTSISHLPRRRCNGGDSSSGFIGRAGFWVAAASLVVLVGGAIWSGSAVAKSASASADCLSFPAGFGLQWPRAGAWIETSGQLGQLTGGSRALLLVDVAKDPPGNLVVLGLNGSLLPAGEHLSVLRGLVHPFLIRSSENRVYIEDRAQKTVFVFDSALQQQIDKIVYGKREVSGGLYIDVLRDWAPIGGDIVALADVKTSLDVKGKYYSSLVRFGKNGMGTSLDTLRSEGATRYPFVANRDYLAALGRDAILLNLTETTSIWRLPGGANAFSAFADVPAEFARQPALEENAEWAAIDKDKEGASRKRALLYYQLFERSKTATAVYSWRGQLYLLVRGEASEARDTPWWLIRIHPDTGQELSRYPLPTQAPHLTIVPGDRWALIQRKGVMPSGKDIYAPAFVASGLLLLPDSWIEDPTIVPFRARSSTTVCQQPTAQ